jgi:hypothetical protein
MYRYRIRYFSTLDWRWFEATVLAESDEQLEQGVSNNLCAKLFRIKRDCITKEECDTLRTEWKDAVSLPLILSDNILT